MLNVDLLKQTFIIAVGGALGSAARYLMSLSAYYFLGRSFPYGTLFVNVLGSFFMGFLSIILINRLGESALWRAFLLIGVLGGFTTFSSFSLETWNLFANGEMLKSVLNILMNVLCCLLVVWLGVAIGREI